MPIIQENGKMSISGVELEQYNELYEKIEAKQSIKELLKQIKPEDLKAFLIFYKPYITDDLSNTDWLSAVHVAAKAGNLEALEDLSAAGADFNIFSTEYGKSPLHFAAGHNHADVIDYLVNKKQLSVDTPLKVTGAWVTNRTALFECALRSSKEAAEKLISLHANVNYQDSEGSTPLHYACCYGFGWSSLKKVEGFVDLLLQHNADTTLTSSIDSYSGQMRTAVDVICGDDHARAHMIKKLNTITEMRKNLENIKNLKDFILLVESDEEAARILVDKKSETICSLFKEVSDLFQLMCATGREEIGLLFLTKLIENQSAYFVTLFKKSEEVIQIAKLNHSIMLILINRHSKSILKLFDTDKFIRFIDEVDINLPLSLIRHQGEGMTKLFDTADKIIKLAGHKNKESVFAGAIIIRFPALYKAVFKNKDDMQELKKVARYCAEFLEPWVEASDEAVFEINAHSESDKRKEVLTSSSSFFPLKKSSQPSDSEEKLQFKL